MNDGEGCVGGGMNDGEGCVGGGMGVCLESTNLVLFKVSAGAWYPVGVAFLFVFFFAPGLGFHRSL